MTNFYFTDRQFNHIKTISTKDTPIFFEMTSDLQSIDNAARSFSGNLIFKDEDFELAKRMTQLGNYILFKDYQGESVFVEINTREEDPVGNSIQVDGEGVGMDLLNEIVPPYVPDKAYPIKDYIERFTKDSGFEIGINEVSSMSRRLNGWESTETSLARIIKVANNFDVELSFSFELSGTEIIKRYIDIRRKRGKDENVTLYVNKEIEKIIIKEDSLELATAIEGVGGSEGDSETKINLKGYKWTDPDKRFELGADGVLRDTKSVQIWSRLLKSGKKSHIQRYREYETTNKATLLNNVLRDLKKFSERAINYKVEIVSFPDRVGIGDTINLVDEQRELYLSSRVLEINYDYVFGKADVVLGDYLIKEGSISQSLQDLANSLKVKVDGIQNGIDLKAEFIKSDVPPEKTWNVIWIDTSDQYHPSKIWSGEDQGWVVFNDTKKGVEDANRYSDEVVEEKIVAIDGKIEETSQTIIRDTTDKMEKVETNLKNYVTSSVTQTEDSFRVVMGEEVRAVRRDYARKLYANMQAIESLETNWKQVTNLKFILDKVIDHSNISIYETHEYKRFSEHFAKLRDFFTVTIHEDNKFPLIDERNTGMFASVPAEEHFNLIEDFKTYCNDLSKIVYDDKDYKIIKWW